MAERGVVGEGWGGVKKDDDVVKEIGDG